MMKKSKNPVRRARTIISRIYKEMQMPRLTASVRNYRSGNAAPVVEKPPARASRIGPTDHPPKA